MLNGTMTPKQLMVSAKTGAPLIDVSQSTWHRMDSAGKLPRPIKLTNGTVRWRYSDIAEWVAAGCPDRET